MLIISLCISFNQFEYFLLSQGEIDAREDSFRSALEAGNRLVDTNHYAADEVREKVSFPLSNFRDMECRVCGRFSKVKEVLLTSYMKRKEFNCLCDKKVHFLTCKVKLEKNY